MKANSLLRLSLIGLVAVSMSMTGARAASLVYSNTEKDLKLRLSATKYEVGDQIILAGTDRSLVQFGFEYYNLTPRFTPRGRTVEAQIRFYANDGGLFNGINGSFTPDTLIYDSGRFEVGPTRRATLWIDDFITGAATPLLQDLPDSFTWSVQFYNAWPCKAGVSLYSPPEVGNNWTDYWINIGGEWQLSREVFCRKVIPMDFAAQFYAKSVPEPEVPAIFALLVAGLGSLLLLRRSRCRA